MAMSVAGFSAQPEIIKLLLSEAVGCDYPVAAHTLLDGRMGLKAEPALGRSLPFQRPPEHP
jgi:hypothetical protein